VATRPVRPGAEGPVREFARSLREVWTRAGEPRLREMARDGFSSAATLSAVHSGRTFPTWEATRAYLRGCGLSDADVDTWQERWLDVADLIGYRGSRPTDVRPHTRGALPTCHELTTIAQYRRGLRQVFRWTGATSQAVFLRRAGQEGVGLARATLSDMLAAGRDGTLPSAASVRLFLAACGLPGEHIDDWLAVHRILQRKRIDDGVLGRYVGQVPLPTRVLPPLSGPEVIVNAAQLNLTKPSDAMSSSHPTRSRPSPAISTLLAARYRLVERIGAGGMSVVWRGFDEVLGREVAVKVLKPSARLDPGFRRRLRAEARAAAGLSHPHITNVYDYGEATSAGDPVPYVVMELVDGESLAQVLARVNRLPWETAVRTTAEVAAAIAAAHARGIVHRDINPSNVMLTPTGVKVVDFGISALIGENEIDADGSLLGTPAYLAPERLEGGQVSPATDVYAIGMLIYRALIGHLPWDVGTTTALLRAHQYAEPEPLPPVKGMPRAVAALVGRCLEKLPANRPASAELAHLLAAISTGTLPKPGVAALPTVEEDTMVLPVSRDIADYRGRHRRA
jgi:Protein kinase domain